LGMEPLSDLGPTIAAVGKGGLYLLQEFRVLEGFEKKGGRANLGGDGSNREILTARYDYDASLWRQRTEMCQHFQSVHGVHPNIQDDHGNRMTHGITEKLFPCRNAQTPSPADSSNRLSAFRTDGSSSTKQMVFDTAPVCALAAPANIRP